jgi:hypothetical protein
MMPMSGWLLVNAGFVPRHVDVDVEQYERTAHDLAFHVTDAVERAVAGAAWLKRRFPAGGSVTIELKVSAGDRLEVGKPRTRNYGGPKGIMCRADIPAGWFAESGDGLLGIRFLRAALQVLNIIGTHYDLGPPPIRSARADTGKPALIDLFAPRAIEPPIFREAADSIDRLVAGMSPAELVLGAVEPTNRGIQRKRLAVAQSLGTVESEQAFRAGEEQQVRAWTIRHTT